MDLIWIYNSNNSCREKILFLWKHFCKRIHIFWHVPILFIFIFRLHCQNKFLLTRSLNFIQSKLMSSEVMRTWYWIWPLHVIPYHLYISILAYVSRADVTHTLSLEVFVSQVMSLLELQWYVCMYWQALISIWSLNSFIFMTNRQNKKRTAIGGDLPFHGTSFPARSLSLVSLCSLLIHLFLSALIRMMSSLHNHRDCRNYASLTVEWRRFHKAKHNWSNTHSRPLQS